MHARPSQGSRTYPLVALDRVQPVVEVLMNSEQVRNFTLQRWQPLVKISLFRVMAADGDHYNRPVAFVTALNDDQQINAKWVSLGRRVIEG